MSNEENEKPAREETAGPAAEATPSPESTPAQEANAPEEAQADQTLQALQADVERFRDLALRTQADFENYRKRAARDREDAVKSAVAAVLERLLPVVDNFELGLQHARSEGSQGVVVGFEMVGKQLQDFLANSGVEVIEAEGKPFDHNLHEAFGKEASDTVPEGHVVRQLRKGYKLKDRLIRPANVFVSSGPAQEEASNA